jgi:hypothetical protein
MYPDYGSIGNEMRGRGGPHRMPIMASPRAQGTDIADRFARFVVNVQAFTVAGALYAV